MSAQKRKHHSHFPSLALSLSLSASFTTILHLFLWCVLCPNPPTQHYVLLFIQLSPSPSFSKLDNHLNIKTQTYSEAKTKTKQHLKLAMIIWLN